MHNRYYEDITGSLVGVYGPFRVYRLMEMAGRDLDLIAETDEHHLIVLANDQDEAVEAIWHYDARMDLPWIVYAVKQHRRIYESMIARIAGEQAQFMDLISQPEYMARWQEWFDAMFSEGRVSSEQSPDRAVERMVANSQSRRDQLRFHQDRITAALHDLEAAHPEGIADVSGEAEDEHERQKQRIEEGRRVAAKWWKHVDKYVDKGINCHSILGPLVTQAGPFHIYQSLGAHGRFDSPPSAYDDGSRVSWTNPEYMILFEDETLGLFDIWPTPYKYVPGAYQICGPARRWFGIWNQAIVAARTALSEASDLDELTRIRESLAWLERLYIKVYDAWLAFDCPDAPADDSDPAYDPSSAVIFDVDQR